MSYFSEADVRRWYPELRPNALATYQGNTVEIISYPWLDDGTDALAWSTPDATILINVRFTPGDPGTKHIVKAGDLTNVAMPTANFERPDGE